jgi:hypothetical protein
MAAMDAHASACTASSTRSIPELAAYLKRAARTDDETVRAICFWLHLNVRYDTVSFFGGSTRSMEAEDVLQERYVWISNFEKGFEMGGIDAGPRTLGEA